MYTAFSIQNIGHIKARAYLDLASTPVTIEFEASNAADPNGVPAHSEVCLHLENRALAAALVEAINGAVAKTAAEIEAAFQSVPTVNLVEVTEAA